MSGLIGGYYFNPQKFKSLSFFKSAGSIMSVGNIDHESSFSDPSLFSLFTVSSNGVHSCGVFESDKYYSVFLGNLYNQINFNIQYDPQGLGSSFFSAALLTDLYEKNGRSFVEFVNGIFICIIWDKVEKKLILVSDRYGYEHLYYYQSGNYFLFSTNIFSLIKIVEDKLSVDSEAIVDIHNFGMICGNRSIISGINLYEPAKYCEIQNGRVDHHRYWNYSCQEPFDCQTSFLKNESKRYISSAVQGAVSGYENVGSLISGGLDSRLLTAVLNELGAAKVAFSYSHTDVKSNEHQIAEMIAHKLDLPFFLIASIQDYEIEEEVRRNLLLTDGQFGFFEMNIIIEISKMYPGIALVNGFLLDTLFKSGWMVFRERDECSRLDTDRLSKIYSISANYLFDSFFSADFADFTKKRKVERVAGEISEEDLDKPEQASFTFYCRNRGRRVHSVISKAYRNYTDIIMPGADYELFDFASRLPYNLRSDSRFYREVIAEWFPEIAAIPWDKTGKPILDGERRPDNSISKYRQRITYYLQRVTHGRFDLQNPPNSFNRKFRQNKIFRDSILGILSDKASLDRGFYDEQKLDRLVREQLHGKDYSKFFNSLLNIEMLHRTVDEVYAKNHD